MIKIKILTEASSRAKAIVKAAADHIRNPVGAPYSRPSDEIRRAAAYQNLTPSETEKIVRDTRPPVAPTQASSAGDKNVHAILTMKAPKYVIGSDNSQASGGQTMLSNFKYDLGRAYSNSSEREIAEKIVSSISQLGAFQIKRALFAGTQGFVYELSNDHILKFYLSAYADDEGRFNAAKKAQFAGQGSVRDPYIIDSGRIELAPEEERPDPYGRPGDTIQIDAIVMKYVEMSKVIPFGEFAGMTKREPSALSQEINYISDNIGTWMEDTISDILITSSKGMSPKQRSTLTDVYDTLSNYDSSYSTPEQRREFVEQYNIKQRYKSKKSTSFKNQISSNRDSEKLTLSEYESAIDLALDNFIREGSTTTGDFHAGNFGVSIQHGFKNPVFIVFDK